MPGENRNITDPNPPSPTESHHYTRVMKVITTSIFRLFQSSTVQNSKLTLSWCQRKARHMPIPHSRNPWYERSPDEVHESQRCTILTGGRLYRCIPLRGIVRYFVFRPSISVTYAIACEQAELSCLGWWRKRVSRQSHARDTKRPQLSWLEFLDESSLVQNSSYVPAPPPPTPHSLQRQSGNQQIWSAWVRSL